ncbi:Histidine-phosphotransfer domain HPT-domain-containing protein [Mycena indigotica]|uniref:Histidine-phosphotransfer domain HPT-domain-containing protein n=1 Tax=Mycena indigotica TaxID=2126181 RepID=A0A8H6W177_9AGAR|nr:Histidine-phosphotransfer domain HPT-domain-containing protein [Mycena indigotica]KAF7299251.1 Histidine-phosphotransfer domain HPT-domain-containing protein [Mycena indigotica]
MLLDLEPDAPIDPEAFTQILELDEDDETRSFSKDMVALYFIQGPEAFELMSAALSNSDLKTVADRAHFIAGSSATIGISRVAQACTQIKQAAEEEDADKDVIRGLLDGTKDAYKIANAWLRKWFAEHGAPFDDEPQNVAEKPFTANDGTHSETTRATTPPLPVADIVTVSQETLVPVPHPPPETVSVPT